MKNAFTLFTIFLLFTSLAHAQIRLDSGLISFYSFDHASLSDSVGNGNWNTIATPDTIEDRFGNPSGAVSLKRISMPTMNTAGLANLPSGQMPRTLSLWFKLNQIPMSGLTNLNFLFVYGSNFTGQSFGLAVGNDEVRIIGYLDDLVANASLLVNNWHHLVATFDGLQASLYLDGNLIAQETKNWFTTASNARLGYFNTSVVSTPTGSTTVYNNYFDGALDEFRIYTRTLNQDEIDSLFQTSVVSSLTKTEPGRAWNFYPNPLNQASAFLSLSNLKKEDRIVEIFDSKGKCVKSEMINSENMEMDLSDLTQGLYLLKIGGHTDKLVIN
jgi:hypothetical protein